MKNTFAKMLLAGTCASGIVGVAEADIVDVDIYGTVVFNGITAPPLGTVTPGQTAHMSLQVDSTVFVDAVPGDVRGYDIIPASFALAFSGGASVGLAAPPAYFSVVDGFPVSDGFFVSSNPGSPGGVPLTQAPYQAHFRVGYTGATLSSLNILDALGTYDFTGLTVFGYNVWTISPDNVVLDINFTHMTITPAPATLFALAPLVLGLRRRRRD